MGNPGTKFEPERAPVMQSPVPYLTDDQYSHLPAVERWLIAASAYVGVQEAGAENHGPEVAKFLASVGLPEGYPWCAAFLTFTAGRAGLNVEKMTGRPARELAAVAAWAKVAGDRKALTYKPQRGTAFYWLKPDGTGHIGLVTGTRDGGDAVGTIEGNTDPAGGREGDGVYRRLRSVDEIRARAQGRPGRYGFIDLGRLVVE